MNRKSFKNTSTWGRSFFFEFLYFLCEELFDDLPRNIFGHLRLWLLIRITEIRHCLKEVIRITIHARVFFYVREEGGK